MYKNSQALLPLSPIARIASAFEALAPTFDCWVRTMEKQTRLWEIDDIAASENVEPNILLISPPTDPGIKWLASRLPQLNCQARISLLCLNDNIRQIAAGYLSGTHLDVDLITLRDETFSLPFNDSIFDVVIANCFFDFCYQHEIPETIQEIRRVLKTPGALFSVHMRKPETCIESIWASFFKQFPCVSHGCHPIDINDALQENGFALQTDSSEAPFGFPIQYLKRTI